jgi:hypothetical protein
MSTLAAQVFSRSSLAHAISGSAGGTLAMLIVYPLDQLRLSAQLASQTKAGETPGGDAPPSGAGMMERAAWIIKHKGFMELYRGLYATLVTLGSSNFIYCAGPPGAFKRRSSGLRVPQRLPSQTNFGVASVWARRTLNRSFRPRGQSTGTTASRPSCGCAAGARRSARCSTSSSRRRQG